MLSAARADSRGDTVAGAELADDRYARAVAVAASSASVDTVGLTGVWSAAVCSVQAPPFHQRCCVTMPAVATCTGSGYHPGGTRTAFVMLTVDPQGFRSPDRMSCADRPPWSIGVSQCFRVPRDERLLVLKCLFNYEVKAVRAAFLAFV